MTPTTRKQPVRRAQYQSTEKTKTIRPTPEIPMIEGPEVPIFSRLYNGEDAPAKWPITSQYQPIVNIVPGEAISEAGKEAIELGLLKENKIHCKCHRGQDCSTNLDCLCGEVSRKLQRQFGSNNLLRDQPIEFKEDNYWDGPMFVCSSSCGCGGRCKQNPLRVMDERQEEKFVIKRENAKGFCLFTNVPIEKGLPVVSFNGEMCGSRAFKKNSMDEQYALIMSAAGDKIINFITTCTFLNKEYRAVLKAAFATKIWINPLMKGNCARFLAHDCKENLELARVFQGGLSPADMRIVLFSKRDISANEELTFNYGKDYKEAHFQGDCLCMDCLKKRDQEPPVRKTRANAHLFP